MAYTFAVNDIVSCSVASFSAGQLGLNTYHWQVISTTGAGITDAQLATSLDLNFAVPMKPLLGNNASYYGVRVSKIWPAVPTMPVVSSAYTGIGSGATSCLPAQVSGIITWQTNLAGRAYRGRTYVPFPFLGANDTVLDIPTAAYKTLLTALGNAFTTYTSFTSGGNSVGLAPCIYHRRTHSVTDVAGFRSNLKWATQKRRGNYGQLNVYPPF